MGPAQQLQVGLENLPFLASSHLDLWGETGLPLGKLVAGDLEKSSRAPFGAGLVQSSQMLFWDRVECSVWEPWNGSRSPACSPAFATRTNVPRSSARTKNVHSSWENGSMDTCSSSLPGHLPSSSETHQVTQPSRLGYLCWPIGLDTAPPHLDGTGAQREGGHL